MVDSSGDTTHYFHLRRDILYDIYDRAYNGGRGRFMEAVVSGGRALSVETRADTGTTIFVSWHAQLLNREDAHMLAIHLGDEITKIL